MWLVDTKRIKVCVNNLGQPFYYNGTLLEEDATTITILDDKEGKLRLNKSIILKLVFQEAPG